jgi:hypothetical protein
MLFRAVPVLAVVIATAVIFPLRRAHLGFPDRAAPTVIATSARPPARRRPGEQRLRPGNPTSVVGARDTGAVRPVRHSLPASTDLHRTPHRAAQSVSAAHRHRQSSPSHFPHRIVEPVTVTFHAERPCGPAPTPTTSVATQAVCDVPEPPPKPATL